MCFSQTESIIEKYRLCFICTSHFRGWQVFVQRPNSWTNPRQKSWEFSFLLFTVTSTDLPWYFYFFKLTQPLTVSTVQLQLLYTVKEKGGKPDRKPYPLPYGLRNPYRNLKSENSQDYAQKPKRNCTFMNSASVEILRTVHHPCHP
jgi:hypothetical protein